MLNKQQYKAVVFNAFECGSAKYTAHKTQQVLTERYGNNLECPRGYEGLSIMEAYMKGYQG